MKSCPFCAEQIQDEAVKCRYCGEFLDGREPRRPHLVGYVPGYEFRSKTELFGLPLVHIAHGVDPETGAPRVARGIVAIGNIAVGVLAFGGIAAGGFVFGGLGLGVVTLGGLAIGGIAFGGLAIGVVFAAGGLAISLLYGVGGLALAPHALDSRGSDPQLLELLERWWPGIRESLPAERPPG